MAPNLNTLSAHMIGQIARPNGRNEPIRGHLMQEPRNIFKWNF